MTDTVKYQEGIREFRAGNYERAGTLFQEALDINDQNHKAWNALGIACSKVGQIEDALTCFENALMIEPGNITYQNNFDKIKVSSKKTAEIKPIERKTISQRSATKTSNRFLSYKSGGNSNNSSSDYNHQNQFEAPYEPLFLYIPTLRLIGMNILTVGWYDIYWLYKNYSFLKQRYELNIDPFGRAFFAIFYYYDLFTRIHDDQHANQVKDPQFSVTTVGVIFYLGIILQVIFSAALGKTDYAFLVWIFLAMEIYSMVQVQSYINEVISLEYPNQGYYGWSTGHIILLILGCIYWLLIIMFVATTGV